MNPRQLATVFCTGIVLLLSSPCHADILSDNAVKAKLDAGVATEKLKQAQSDYDAALKQAQALLTLTKTDWLSNADVLQKAPISDASSYCGEQVTKGEAWPASCTKRLSDAQLAQSKYLKEQPGLEDLNLRSDAIETNLKNAQQTQSILVEPALDFCPPNGAETAPDWISRCTERLKAGQNTLKTLTDAKQKLDDATRDQANKQKAADDATQAVLDSSSAGPHLSDRMSGARKARCLTAFCWGGYDGMQYALEPFLDLPVSMFWAVGTGGLANHINSNKLDVSVDAGVRYWFAYDAMSMGILLARPSLTSTSSIRIDTSNRPFPATSIRRPYPTLVLGFVGDTFMLSASYDQVRNTDGLQAVDPAFTYEQVVSRTVTIGVSINMFTLARNMAGASTAKTQDKSSGGTQ